MSSFYSAGPVLSLMGLIQPKSTIGQPDDPYEQEADRVAAQVISIPEPRLQRKAGCPECEEEEEKEPVQTKQIGGPGPQQRVIPEAHIHSVNCPGRPLSPSTREFFEPRLARDFSNVRVHTCGSAERMSRELKAQAFTYGNNIYFNQGKYNPETLGGKQLLAHELTHVVQQQGNPFRLQRLTDPVVECTRTDAEACLVHLHGSESEALEAAKDRYCQYCVNLVYINHPDCRLVRVEVPGKGITCCADPNRIFDDSAIGASWNQWNRNSFDASWGNATGECSKDYKKCRQFEADAVKAIKDYRDTKLLPAINRCRVLPKPEMNHKSPLPVIAFHGNTPGNLNIGTFSGSRDTARYRKKDPTHRDSVRLQQAFDQLKVNPGSSNPVNPPAKAADPRSLKNPHIQRQEDRDDFFLATDWHDFVAFVQKGRNVVLQAADPPNDGSLSVLLKSSRYINIEVERHFGKSSRSSSDAILMQKTMTDEALQALGIIPKYCPAPTTPGCPSCPAPTPQTPPSSAKQNEG